MLPNLSFNRASSKLILMLIFSALIVTWILFAPMQVGGSAAYVIVYGNSMEPLYQRNDLIVLRSANDPQVGDIFAYRQPDLGLVIHRIKAVDGERFIFQGDHNNFEDSYRPSQSELVGRAWIHIPQGGNVLLAIRQPWVLAVLVLLVGGFLMVELNQNPKSKKEKSSKRFQLAWPSGPTPSQKDIFLMSLPILLLVSLILAFFSFRTPTSLISSNDLEFTHLVIFDYSAVTNSTLIDGGLMAAPQPIFPKLGCKVDFVMSYAFGAVLPSSIKGTYQINAQLSEVSGWQKKIEIVPETAFEGENFSKKFVVDVCKLQQITNDFIVSTGVPRSAFQLLIVPKIVVSGMLADLPVDDSVSPSLEFTLEPAELYLTNRENLSNPLSISTVGMISLNDQRFNTFSIFGLQVPIMVFRWVSLLGIIGSLIGLWMLGLPVLRALQKDPLQAIRGKYEDQIIRLSPGQMLPNQTEVIVASMADLSRLATQSGLPIFEDESSGQFVYTVVQHSINYRFVLQINQEYDS